MKKSGIVRGLRNQIRLERAEAKRIAKECAAKVIAAIKRRKVS